MRAQPESTRRWNPTAARLGWGLGDQAVSSLTNFAVGLVVARELGAKGFGVFGIAWVTYTVVLNMSRGVATDPLMVRHGGEESHRQWAAAARSAVGTALAVGLAAGAVLVAAAPVVGHHLGPALLVLGLVLPAVLVQDAWRFAFFAAGAGGRSLLNDAVWAVALVPALLFAARVGSVPAFLLAWGGAGAVAAAFGVLQAGFVPSVRGSGAWLRRHRELGSRYLVENVSFSGAAQLRVYGLGAMSGLAAVGAVRGAELLLGPFLMLLYGLSLVTVAEGARVLRRMPERLLRFSLALGAVQSAAAVAWGSVLLALPDGLGRSLLGALWDQSAPLVLPATLAVVGASWSTAAAAGVRALGAARRSLRAQLFASTAYLAGGLLGAGVDGARGSAWGVAAATLGSSTVWWAQLRRGLRDHLADLDRTGVPSGVAALPLSAGAR